MRQYGYFVLLPTFEWEAQIYQNRIVQLGGNRKVKCENVFVSLGVSVSLLTKGTTKWQTSHPSGVCSNVSAFESTGFTHHFHQLLANEGVLGVIKNN